MNTNYTKIIFVIDRSGSMDSIAKDVIGGYNRFIEDQKKLNAGKCTVSFYQFDDRYDVVYQNVDINHVKELTSQTFVPRGSTALLDAVGKTIDSVGVELSATPEAERPAKVLFVIITDGEENASTEFNTTQIRNKIKHQTEVYNWNFVYIGANQDAWAVAGSLGISKNSSLTYSSTTSSSLAMFGSLSNNTATLRCAALGATYSFTQADIDAQNKAH